MFGIVVASLDNLDEDEKARYQQIYCGICHSLKDRYGQITRFCVSFDMAFLASLLESLFEQGEEMLTGRCALHPAKPHYYVSGAYVDFAADMSLVLAYHKCIDNWFDDNSASSFAYSKALERAYRLARVNHAHVSQTTEKMLAHIRDLESNSLEILAKCEENPSERDSEILLMDADDIARSFGLIMGEMFSVGPQVIDSPWQDTMFHLGSALGRFVYFMDAALDRDEDKENNAYNPFNVSNYPEDALRIILEDAIGDATRIFEKLPLEKDLHLLRSVLYAGVWQRMHDNQKEADGKMD